MTSHGRKHMGLAIATMLLLLTTTATASAQSSAEIEGSVVDANGNPLYRTRFLGHKFGLRGLA